MTLIIVAGYAAALAGLAAILWLNEKLESRRWKDGEREQLHP